MKDLIEALTIFLKYGDPHYPTHCEHDELFVMVDPSVVSSEDANRLHELGFNEGEYAFTSFRFGSA